MKKTIPAGIADLVTLTQLTLQQAAFISGGESGSTKETIKADEPVYTTSSDQGDSSPIDGPIGKRPPFN